MAGSVTFTVRFVSEEKSTMTEIGTLPAEEFPSPARRPRKGKTAPPILRLTDEVGIPTIAV
jgi:hypothetical protein